MTGELPAPTPPHNSIQPNAAANGAEQLPATFTAPPHARELLEHLASGQPASAWLRKTATKRSELAKWVAKDAVFAKQYARARAQGHDAIAEELLAIADADLPQGPDATAEVARRRLALDTRKWLLARWDGRYADRPEAGAASVSVTIATGVPGQAPSASRITVESSAPRALPDAGDDDDE